MEKILVTGSQGYIGRVIFELLQSGGFKPEPLKIRLEEILPGSLNHKWIIHCAGALRHRVNDLYNSNVLGTEKLIKGVKNPDCRVIFLSSRAVYSQGSDFIREDSKLGTLDDEYGNSKLEGERIVVNSGLSNLILRLTNTYGLGVGNLNIGFPAKALMDFMNNKPVTLHDPDRLHDFLYVWDLASLVVRAVNENLKAELVINVSSDPSSLHGFIRLLAEVYSKKTRKKPRIEVIPGPPPRNSILDNRLLKRTFPGFNFTPPEIVFRRMVEYVLSGSVL